MRTKSAYIRKSGNNVVKVTKQTEDRFWEVRHAGPLILTEDNPFYEFNTVELREYSPEMDAAGFKYQLSHDWIHVGKSIYNGSWLLFISTNTLSTYKLLPVLLHFLKEHPVSFKMIRNGYLNYRLNCGDLGENEVGKVITLFPESISHATELIKFIKPMLQGLNGPLVEGALKIDNCLFTAYAQIGEKLIDGRVRQETIFPELTNVAAPFPISKESHKLLKKKTKAGFWCVITDTVKQGCKGNVYEGTYLKGLPLRDCIVKEAKPYAIADPIDRFCKDRLLWEKEFLLDLKGKAFVPKYYAFVEKSGFSYLIMEKIKGTTFIACIKEIQAGRRWRHLGSEQKKGILSNYQKVIISLQELHIADYIHRDISAKNVIMRKGQAILTDGELSYNKRKRRPLPPFFFGTEGYVAPEQLICSTPSIQEDIYSLGALLIVCLTGEEPKHVINKNALKTKSNIEASSDDEEINSVILRCLSKNPSERPDLDSMLTTITQKIQTM